MRWKFGGYVECFRIEEEGGLLLEEMGIVEFWEVNSH
jgi:hypothetical protein